MITNEQALYYKNYLQLKNPGDDIQRISSSLFSSKISINPHQINAALKFFKNPLTKGMIFADEVGLGKTIEAGLVISQYWYEKRRKILIVAPASLMKQWNEELYSKFHLESVILSSTDFKNPNFNFDNNIYITSYNSIYLNEKFFARKYDLVVIDEAHKLRNVYKETGIMSVAIKRLFDGQKKLLLTATPFQNNLMELYGLMSVIDEKLLSDPNVFKKKYITDNKTGRDDLANLLDNFIVRTLRKDVTKYINYTKRNVSLLEYEPSEDEIYFDELISNIMYSDDFSKTYKMGQSHLVIILLLKMLSSSRYAVTKTLSNMMNKLLSGESIEINDSEYNIKIDSSENENRDGLIRNIKNAIDTSFSISHDSKLKKLLETLKNIDSLFVDTNRNKKILIFTESKQTQKYLFEKITSETDYKVLLFNGDNSGKEINEIYNNWKSKQKVDISGNKDVNIRRALVDAFQNEYDILIATDAAAEGLNMQFCSVMINYDLPWNPQKIEQRIGRCHRYGQTNDVVVLNFLNKNSYIDNHIYTLLNGKLGIFEETFGSSDAILGSSDMGDDIEKSIRDIFKKCRNPEDIKDEFQRLQKEYEKEINEARKKTEEALEENFDEEVQKNFEMQYVKANNIVNEMEYLLFKTMVFLLNAKNALIDNFTFNYGDKCYTVSNKYSEQYEFLSLNSSLVQNTFNNLDIISSKQRNSICLKYYDSGNKIGYIEANKLKKGIIKVSKVIYDSFDLTESLILTGISEQNDIIPSDICHKLLKLDAFNITADENMNYINLNEIHSDNINNRITEIEEYNQDIFSQESEYINNWADNMIEKVQLSVQEMREERKRLQMEFDFSNDNHIKADIQEKIRKISKKITRSWIELAELEDEIEERRKKLIDNLNEENKRKITTEDLFEVEFIIK